MLSAALPLFSISRMNESPSWTMPDPGCTTETDRYSRTGTTTVTICFIMDPLSSAAVMLKEYEPGSAFPCTKIDTRSSSTSSPGSPTGTIITDLSREAVNQSGSPDISTVAFEYHVPQFSRSNVKSPESPGSIVCVSAGPVNRSLMSNIWVTSMVMVTFSWKSPS